MKNPPEINEGLPVDMLTVSVQHGCRYCEVVDPPGATLHHSCGCPRDGSLVSVPWYEEDLRAKRYPVAQYYDRLEIPVSSLETVSSAPAVPVPLPLMNEPLFLRTMLLMCRVAGQDPRFRTEAYALAKEYEAIMEANGVHFCGCSCGCNGAD